MSNAGAMVCRFANQCRTYYNTGYSGNYDWELGSEVGKLYYTYRHAGSLKLS